MSLYLDAGTADRLETAVEQILTALGDSTPRHVALSALLDDITETAPTVARRLVEQRAAELAGRLAALPPTSE